AFFFQAEDGIRDRNVTGVQTCALPISQDLADLVLANDEARRGMFGPAGSVAHDGTGSGQVRIQTVRTAAGGRAYIVHAPPTGGEIGRASCRGRGQSTVATRARNIKRRR